MTDDLLDVRSTEETMGKRVGKDCGEGKAHLSRCWAWTRALPTQHD